MQLIYILSCFKVDSLTSQIFNKYLCHCLPPDNSKIRKFQYSILDEMKKIEFELLNILFSYVLYLFLIYYHIYFIFVSHSLFSEFKECFSFNARKNQISQVEELSLIMRSLGFSPTREEVIKYLEKYKNGQYGF